MSHSLRSLVRNRLFHVEHCAGCDVLHLTVGPITLRLEVNATRQLVVALSEALAKLDERAEPRPVSCPTAALSN